MTTFIKNKSVIVVGEDYSQNSNDALKAVCSFTDALSEVAIHIVHVVKRGPLLGGHIESSSVEASSHELSHLGNERAALKDVTSSAATEAWANGAHVFGHLRIGNPAREIVQLASDLSADLIAVGAHGRTGRMKLLLGSVAQNVLTHASCPVLVVKPKEFPSSLEIETPCVDCATARESSRYHRVWCERHSQHHANAHTYYVHTESFGLSAPTFRGLS